MPTYDGNINANSNILVIQTFKRLNFTVGSIAEATTKAVIFWQLKLRNNTAFRIHTLNSLEVGVKLEFF